MKYFVHIVCNEIQVKVNLEITTFFFLFVFSILSQLFLIWGCKKTTSSIWQHTRCKCSQHNQIKKHALCCEYLQCVSLFVCVVSICSASLYLFVLWAFAVRFFICLCCEYLQCVSLFVCVVSICSAFLYLFVLWVFAVRFFICLCCEYLPHLLSNWWRCFLDLLVLFLFAWVFYSCSTLSSLGHRKWLILQFCTILSKEIKNIKN